MSENKVFDVIIIGGSYSGLSAAMALGRALRNVLVIDNGQPCNRQTPFSHNFITQDGKKPKAIATLAKAQVEKYETVTFYDGLAINGTRNDDGFSIQTQTGENFSAKKLIFATGIKDIMPTIKGFAECWGISVIHCPYCHGYEVKNVPTGILYNGEMAYDFAKLILNWTKDLTLFTNGKPIFTDEQNTKLNDHNIAVVDKEIDAFEQQDGHIQKIIFKDGTTALVTTLYAKLPFVQHCDIPEQLGCTLNLQHYITIDAFQKTTVPGVFACGDNASFMRSVSNSVAMGTLAGAMANKEIIDDEF